MMMRQLLNSKLLDYKVYIWQEVKRNQNQKRRNSSGEQVYSVKKNTKYVFWHFDF